MFWQEIHRENLAPPLTSVEIQLRDLFVTEYLKDFDPVCAAIRCGFNKGIAEDYAKRFWDEPYVQQKISEAKTKLSIDDAFEKENFALTIATLRQAMQNGPYASRVSAARELKALYGWESKQTESEEDAIVKAMKEFASQAPV